MKIKSLHQHKVRVPIPGKDPIYFLPGEIKEIDNGIAKKLLESKGYEECTEIRISTYGELKELNKEEQIDIIRGMDKNSKIPSKENDRINLIIELQKNAKES